MDGLINQFQRFYSESFLDELLFLATALSDKVHLVAIRAIFKVQHSGLENRSINVWALFLTIAPPAPTPPHPRASADHEFCRTQGNLHYALFTMQNALCT